MTENDTYLKMILALDPDFFKECELNDGDQVYLLKDIDDYTNSGEYGLYTVFDNLLANEGVNDTENWHYVKWMLADGVIKPIPSQEQLQDMCIEYHMKRNGFSIKRATLHIMGWFADYLKDVHDRVYRTIENGLDYEEYGDPGDFSITMLKYTVNLILDKRWNGEIWL